MLHVATHGSKRADPPRSTTVIHLKYKCVSTRIVTRIVFLESTYRGSHLACLIYDGGWSRGTRSIHQLTSQDLLLECLIYLLTRHFTGGDDLARTCKDFSSSCGATIIGTNVVELGTIFPPVKRTVLPSNPGETRLCSFKVFFFRKTTRVFLLPFHHLEECFFVYSVPC